MGGPRTHQVVKEARQEATEIPCDCVICKEERFGTLPMIELKVLIRVYYPGLWGWTQCNSGALTRGRVCLQKAQSQCDSESRNWSGAPTAILGDSGSCES